jgi:methyl-accepting chemotaxis protein
MAGAAEMQSTGIQEVNAAVGQMDQVTQQNAAMVEQSTAAAKNLAEETRVLMDLVSFFHVGDVGVAPTKTAPPRIVKSTTAPVRAVVNAKPVSASPVKSSGEDWAEF